MRRLAGEVLGDDDDLVHAPEPWFSERFDHNPQLVRERQLIATDLRRDPVDGLVVSNGRDLENRLGAAAFSGVRASVLCVRKTENHQRRLDQRIEPSPDDEIRHYDRPDPFEDAWACTWEFA